MRARNLALVCQKIDQYCQNRANRSGVGYPSNRHVTDVEALARSDF
jgi:hypothetical protein